jgi:hypothetical protein
MNFLCFEFVCKHNKQVPTVPLKTPIDSIKFDPTCQHRKRLTTNQQQQQALSVPIQKQTGELEYNSMKIYFNFENMSHFLKDLLTTQS